MDTPVVLQPMCDPFETEQVILLAARARRLIYVDGFLAWHLADLAPFNEVPKRLWGPLAKALVLAHRLAAGYELPESASIRSGACNRGRS